MGRGVWSADPWSLFGSPVERPLVVVGPPSVAQTRRASRRLRLCRTFKEKIQVPTTGAPQVASDLSFVEYVVDQLDDDCVVTYKKMFGEFGPYSDAKLFGLICDN